MKLARYDKIVKKVILFNIVNLVSLSGEENGDYSTGRKNKKENKSRQKVDEKKPEKLNVNANPINKEFSITHVYLCLSMFIYVYLCLSILPL
jgi:hypothetical protein